MPTGILKGFLGLGLLVLLRTITEGILAWVIWGWFVVPYWNLSQPSPIVFAGLVLLVGVMIGSELTRPLSAGDWLFQAMNSVLLKPIIVLIVAFILYKISGI